MTALPATTNIVTELHPETSDVPTEALIVATTTVIATTRPAVGKKKPIKKVKARKNFPETWLWIDMKLK